LIAEREDDFREKAVRGVLIVAILGLLLLIVPDHVDFSFDLGKLKLDKLVGQKEVLCLIASMTMYRLTLDFGKFAHYRNLYEHRIEIDFKDGGDLLVRNVVDDKLPLQFGYVDDNAAWKWLRRFETISLILVLLIIIGSVGAVFVVTTVNIIRLYWSPAIGGSTSYILLTASVGFLLLFLSTLCEDVILVTSKKTAHRLREKNSEAAGKAE
jgi:hypothetical protein